MLCHLEHHSDIVILDLQGAGNVGQLAIESDVHHGTDDLCIGQASRSCARSGRVESHRSNPMREIQEICTCEMYPTPAPAAAAGSSAGSAAAAKPRATLVSSKRAALGTAPGAGVAGATAWVSALKQRAWRASRQAVPLAALRKAISQAG